MIRALTLPDAYYVCRFMRTIDRDEVFGLRWNDDVEALAIELYQTQGPKYAVVKHDEPVVIGGIAGYTPGVGSCWMVATPKLSQVRIETTRFARKLFGMALQGGDYHRLFAVSAAYHTQSHEWLRALGMQRESRMTALGRNADDYYCFARTKGVSHVR